ncbi:protein ABHD18 [Teleopsis dalmanni]|uniref:protein ABHD18 n=1 Tax=Teleopsis dalmanni TaxID=139649 RepID=UPI0018CD6785|nr:protein ABHD18 [Teleopsis dalmanni]
MGGCLILECLVLLHWCERNGFGPLGITGLSMGGHMASLAATNWPKPIVLVPCLSWSTASTVFTTGVMSQSINWDMLETQYFSDGKYCERLSKMVTVIDDAFTAGQTFIKNFNQSLSELKQDIQDTSHAFGKNVISNKKDIKSFRNNNKAENYVFTNLMKHILPKSNQNAYENIGFMKTNWWEREALQFMRGIMDECTHLKNFSVPVDTSLIIVVCAKDDAYVPREGCSSLEDIWPGVEIRYLDAGHVSAYVLHQKLFRSCIIELFKKSITKLYEENKNSLQDVSSNLSYQQLLDRYAENCKN